MNIAEIFRNGQCHMRNPKYQRILHALDWRQKYLKSEYYELSIGEDFLSEPIILKFRQIDNGEMKGLGTGSFLWPAAHILSKFLEKYYHGNMKNLRVCDIGSGTGCTGIVAAALGGQVTLTDQQQILFLLEYNKMNCWDHHGISENSMESHKISWFQGMMESISMIEIKEYSWGENADNLHPPFDVVLVSDCVLPKLYPIDILVKAVSDVMGSHSVAWFSYEHRPFPEYHPRQMFEKLAKEYGLSMEIIPISAHHPIYSCDDIEIWKVTRLSSAREVNFSTETRDDISNSISTVTLDKFVEPLEWGEVAIVPLVIRRKGISRSFEITIKQFLGQTNTNLLVTGTYLWPSSVITSRFLLSQFHEEMRQLLDRSIRESSSSSLLNSIDLSKKRLRALELGSGCGLTAISLWLAGYDVHATDKSYVLELLRQNIHACMTSLKQQFYLCDEINSLGTIESFELDWFSSSVDHEPAPDNIHRRLEELMLQQNQYDLVVCSDCFYSSPAVRPIIQVLQQVCSKDTILLITNELRSAFDEFYTISRHIEPFPLTFEEIFLTQIESEICAKLSYREVLRPMRLLVGKFLM